MSFLKKTISTLATQVVLMIIGVAIGVITARVLGPELKGQAALLTMLSQLLFMFGGMGLGSAFSFYIAKQRFPSRQILSLAVTCSLLLGSGVVVAFFTTWTLHASVWKGIPPDLIFSAALLGIVFIFASYLSRIVVGYGRIYSLNMAESARSLSNFIAIVAFLLVWNHGLEGVMASLWLSALIQVIVLLYFLRADLRPARFWGGGLITHSFGYGIKSHALLLINFLNYRLDILLLGYFTDASTVGFYSLAVGMAELMWLVPNSAVAPLFSGVAASDDSDRSLITLRTCRWSIVFLIVLSSIGVFLGQPFIQLLYGREFLPSYSLYLWLLPGVCLFPLFKLLVVDLAARGNPGYGTIASAIALIINVIANIVLIPRMGASGAALATSISYACMSLISLSLFMKVTEYSLGDIFVIDAEERTLIRQAIVLRFSRFGIGKI